MGMNALEVRRRVMLAQPHEAVASGAVASFRTDVISPLPLEFDLVPIQDLHGQANPYPPGGGKNKLPSINATQTINGVVWTLNSDGSVKLTNTATANSVYDFGRNEVIKLPAGTYTTYDETVTGVYSVTVFIVVNGTASVLKSGGGMFILSEESTVFVRYVVSSGVTVNTTIYPQIEEGAKTTYAPYENLCPITGHDGFTRTGTGKNLLGGLALGQAIVDAVNKPTHSDFGSNSDGNYVTITASSYTSNKVFTSKVKFKENTRYTFILRLTRYQTGTNLNSNIGVLYTDGTSSVIYFSTTADTEVKTIAYTTSANKTVKALATFLGGGTTRLVYENSGSFEGVLTADQFAADVGHSYETTFPTPPGTVYGGHVKDNGDGTYDLTVTHEYTDLGDLSWVNAGQNKLFYTTGVNDKIRKAKSNSEVFSWGITSIGLKGMTYSAIGTNTPYSICVSTAGNILATLDTGTTYTAASFGEAMSGVQFVYKLATPVTYTNLTLTALQSIIGQNHVWVDNADSVTVEYWGH